MRKALIWERKCERHCIFRIRWFCEMSPIIDFAIKMNTKTTIHGKWHIFTIRSIIKQKLSFKNWRKKKRFRSIIAKLFRKHWSIRRIVLLIWPNTNKNKKKNKMNKGILSVLNTFEVLYMLIWDCQQIRNNVIEYLQLTDVSIFICNWGFFWRAFICS